MLIHAETHMETHEHIWAGENNETLEAVEAVVTQIGHETVLH